MTHEFCMKNYVGQTWEMITTLSLQTYFMVYTLKSALFKVGKLLLQELLTANLSKIYSIDMNRQHCDFS